MFYLCLILLVIECHTFTLSRDSRVKDSTNETIFENFTENTGTSATQVEDSKDIVLRDNEESAKTDSGVTEAREEEYETVAGNISSDSMVKSDTGQFYTESTLQNDIAADKTLKNNTESDDSFTESTPVTAEEEELSTEMLTDVFSGITRESSTRADAIYPQTTDILDGSPTEFSAGIAPQIFSDHPNKSDGVAILDGSENKSDHEVSSTNTVENTPKSVDEFSTRFPVNEEKEVDTSTALTTEMTTQEIPEWQNVFQELIVRNLSDVTGGMAISSVSDSKKEVSDIMTEGSLTTEITTQEIPVWQHIFQELIVKNLPGVNAGMATSKVSEELGWTDRGSLESTEGLELATEMSTTEQEEPEWQQIFQELIVKNVPDVITEMSTGKVSNKSSEGDSLGTTIPTSVAEFVAASTTAGYSAKSTLMEVVSTEIPFNAGVTYEEIAESSTKFPNEEPGTTDAFTGIIADDEEFANTTTEPKEIPEISQSRKMRDLNDYELKEVAERDTKSEGRQRNVKDGEGTDFTELRKREVANNSISANSLEFVTPEVAEAKDTATDKSVETVIPSEATSSFGVYVNNKPTETSKETENSTEFDADFTDRHMSTEVSFKNDDTKVAVNEKDTEVAVKEEDTEFGDKEKDTEVAVKEEDTEVGDKEEDTEVSVEEEGTEVDKAIDSGGSKDQVLPTGNPLVWNSPAVKTQSVRTKVNWTTTVLNGEAIYTDVSVFKSHGASYQFRIPGGLPEDMPHGIIAWVRDNHHKYPHIEIPYKEFGSDVEQYTGPPSELPLRCGTKFLEKLSGGKSTPIEENPWQVAVLRRDTEAYVCGGAVITRRHVLSAAHCFKRKMARYSPEQVLLRVGDYDKEVREESQVDYSVVELHVHDHYQEKRHLHDIAILTTSGDIPFSSHVYPICLPTPWAQYDAGLRCTVSGWGQMGSTQEPTRYLRSGIVSIVSHDECRKKTIFSRGVPPEIFCAEDPTKMGVDTCLGDSGGPFACSRNGTFYLYGITAFGSYPCGQDIPSFYTNVSFYKLWILRLIGSNATVTS